MNPRFPQSRSDVLWLALLFTLFAAVTLVWLRLDRLPPNWDDAWYLTNSLVLFDALTHDGIAGWLVKFMHVMGFKAPLITALPTPLYLIFGRCWRAAFFVNIAAMLVLFVCLGRLARRWSSTRAAWIAVWIAGTMPLLYGLARWYMVEYVLAATVTLAVLLLEESDGLQNANLVFVFGLVRVGPATEVQLRNLRRCAVSICLDQVTAARPRSMDRCGSLRGTGTSVVRSAFPRNF